MCCAGAAAGGATAAAAAAAAATATAATATLADVAPYVARHADAGALAALACASRACRDAANLEGRWAHRRFALERFALAGFAPRGRAAAPPAPESDKRPAAAAPRGSQEAEADACEAALRRGGSDWRGLLADCTLGATAVSQLLHSALGSSTVDNASESAHNTLKPSVCTDPSRRHQCTCQRPWPLAQRPCYWSSAGSTNPASDDWLLYRLSPAGPMVIEALTLAPYCAFWQPIDPATGRYPTYWPDAVQVELRDGEGDVLYVSEAFRVSEEGLGGSSNAAEGSEVTAASPQRFELRPPVLAARGGLELRVHLLGKRQRQTMFEADDHYVCVNYVLAEGKVLTAHQAEWVSREGGEPVPALNAAELERFNPADSAPTAPPRVAMATCQSCGESAALKNGGAPRRALARSAATDSATRPPGAELALSRTAMRCSVCKMLRAPLACECGSAWFCNADCRRQSHVMRGAGAHTCRASTAEAASRSAACAAHAAAVFCDLSDPATSEGESVRDGPSDSGASSSSEAAMSELAAACSGGEIFGGRGGNGDANVPSSAAALRAGR